MQRVDDVLKKFGLSRIRHAPGEVEEVLYGIAAHELEQEEHSLGLMAKAFSESEGDENKAKALYLKLRVNQLQRELEDLAEQKHLAAQEDDTQVGSEPEDTAQDLFTRDEWIVLTVIAFIMAVLLVAGQGWLNG